MRTYSAKPADVQKKWYVIDAEGLVLGRMAAIVADILRGKHKTMYTPHIDTGDHVIIVNADKIVVTSNKLSQKFAYRHSGYPGGIKATSWQTLMDEKPTQLIESAVKGMVPKTRLGRAQMGKLFIYAGPDHPHAAQQPQPYDTSAIRRG